MNNLDIFQARFEKMDEFGWWYLERISADSGMQFTYTKFQYECQTRSVQIALAAPEHQKMNGHVEVTRRIFCTIAHSLMVHAQVLEAYINFALMYTVDHIFLVLQIKYLINEEGEPTSPFKLATGTKPSIFHLRILFCPCVLQKGTRNVGTKYLNIRHQAQKCFCGIFVGIPQHQK